MSKKAEILRAIKMHFPDETEMMGASIVERMYEGGKLDAPDDASHMSLEEGVNVFAASLTIAKFAYDSASLMIKSRKSNASKLTNLEVDEAIKDGTSKALDQGELDRPPSKESVETAETVLKDIFGGEEE